MSLRNLAQIMFIYDAANGILPATMEELWKFVAENEFVSSPASILIAPDGTLYSPMLTKPGAVLAELASNTLVLLSNLVDGIHLAMLAKGEMIRIPPKKLDEIIARGDWRYH